MAESASNSTISNRSRLLAVIIIVVIAVVIGIGLWLAARPVPGQIQGMLDTDEIRVAAKAPGRLATLGAAEGDTVSNGQVLFTLTNEELDAKVREVKALEQSVAALRDKAEKGAQDEDITSAKALWQAQQAAAEVAQKTLVRVENLYAEGVLSAQKRDEVVASAAATAEAAAAAKAQYEKAIAGTRPEDKAAVAAQLRQAAAGLEAVKSLEAELKASAPTSGQITRRFANVGEVVPAGYPVFSMIEPDNIWVSLHVREDQFCGIDMGKTIIGTVPALDNQKVVFKIYFINPQGAFATWRAVRESSGYDIKTFEVRARPVEKIPRMRPGMSVLFDWPQN